MFKQLTRKLHQWFAVADREGPGDTGNAIRAEPDQDWFERGLALRRVGNREAALECFRRAVESRHDDVNALVNQTEIQAEHGQHGHRRLFRACTRVCAGFGRCAPGWQARRDAGDETRA